MYRENLPIFLARMGCLLTVGASLLIPKSTHAAQLTLDWNQEDWDPAGSLNQSFSIGNGTVDMNFTGSTGSFVSGTPDDTTVLNGSLTTEETLRLQADFPDANDSVLLTTQFNGYQEITDVSFTLYDIDLSGTSWQDRIIVNGSLGGVSVNPSFTVVDPNNVSVTGNRLDGLQNVNNELDGGNVIVSFDQPIDTYTLEFTQDPTIPYNGGNPSSHGIAMGSVSYREVPFEFSPGLGIIFVAGFFGCYKLREKLKNISNTEVQTE